MRLYFNDWERDPTDTAPPTLTLRPLDTSEGVRDGFVWVRKAAAVSALRRHQTWIDTLTKLMMLREANYAKLHDVVVWSLDYLDYRPDGFELKTWIKRFQHRKGFSLETLGRSANSRRAARDLVELAISEIEALPFETCEVSLLPGIRTLSPEQRLRRVESGRKGAATRRAKKALQQAALEARIEAATC